MLIQLRDNNGKLLIKDLLDIDFDMSVVGRGEEYFVTINHKYELAEKFTKEKDAEDRMIAVANARNSLEEELRIY